MKERMSVTVSSETLAEVKRMAERDRRSLSSMVNVILASAAEGEKQKSR